jgi:predicted Zn finger-like uncharacterized protein
MLIVCPSCASSYQLDPTRIGSGRTVRCASCRELWFVEGSPEVVTAEGPRAPLVVEAEAAREAPLAETTPRRSRPRRLRLPRLVTPRLIGPVVALLALALLGAAVLFRANVVARLPETARLYASVGLAVNLRGLEFREVSADLMEASRAGSLVVEGEIVNVSRSPQAVPPIETAIRDANGRTVYRWTSEPPAERVGPGETVRFRSRLAAPPPEGRAVFVRFAPAPAGPALAGRVPSS